MKKKYYLLFILFALNACSQTPTKIVYNDKNFYGRNAYQTGNYYRGDYKTSPDGRQVRDLSIKKEESFNISLNKSRLIGEIDNENVDKSDNGFIVEDTNNTANSTKINKNNYNSLDNDEYEYIIANPGENLFRIAKNNNVAFLDLARWNNISEPYNISVGQRLRLLKNRNNINNSNSNNYSNNYSNTQTNNNITANNRENFHIVQQGETAYSISKMYNLKLNEFATLNNFVEPYTLSIGQRVIVKNNGNITNKNNNNTNDVNTNNLTLNNTNKTSNIGNSSDNFHIVQQGETAYSISKMYNLKLNEFATLNNFVEPYVLSIGQRVAVGNNSNINVNTTESANTNKGFANNTTTKENNIENTNNSNGETLASVNTIDNTNKNIASATGTINKNTSKNEYIWPIKGEVVAKFGDKINEKIHDGINIKASAGAPVKAVKDGEIAYAGNELKGYGNIVIIRHANNVLTIYAHCEKLNVKVKDQIKQGETIGTIGSTGNVDFPQLYFSIREGRTSVDPLTQLK